MSLATTEQSTLRFMLRALSYRNYRLFFGGQLVSMIGTWLSMVATSWLVYRLAHVEMPHRESLVLGVVGFAGQIPVFLLAPFAGVWVDRWPRQKILVVTQALAMLQSFALAWLTISNVITIPQVIALAALQGFINAFDMPSRQSFVVELVRPNDLSNAIALNASMVHGARFIGPAIAGFLIYKFREGACFLIDGISYFAVLVALLAIRTEKTAAPAVIPRAWHSLQEGVRYAFGFPPIRALLAMVGTISLIAMSQSALMPIFAEKILHGEERTFGFLLGASGFGALTGSLYLASRRSILGLGRIIAIAACILGTSLVLFSLSTNRTLSMAILAFTGGSVVVNLASCNTVLQSIVDDDKRGRIMSLFTMAFFGMAPFGSLMGGALASVIGAPAALRIFGLACIAAGIFFARKLPTLRDHTRPIYIKKGILPGSPEEIPQ